MKGGLVSILVLVDLAHEFSLLTSPDTTFLSFNPCFSGSCSRIMICSRLIKQNIQVSILVLVDLAHEFKSNACISYTPFVSILVLVDLAHELRFHALHLPQLHVSILVLVDLAHELQATKPPSSG